MPATEELLTGGWKTENGFDARAIGNFFRRASGAFQPSVEILEFHGMLDGDVHDRDFDDIHPLGDAHDPIIATNGDKAESYSFIESFCRDFDSVSDAIHIANGDAARAHRHNGRKLIIFAFSSPHKNQEATSCYKAFLAEVGNAV